MRFRFNLTLFISFTLIILCSFLLFGIINEDNKMPETYSKINNNQKILTTTSYFTINTDINVSPEIYVIVWPNFVSELSEEPDSIIDTYKPSFKKYYPTKISIWISNWDEIKENFTHMHLAIPGEIDYLTYIPDDYDCNLNSGYSIRHNLLDFSHGSGFALKNKSNFEIRYSEKHDQTDLSIQLSKVDRFGGVLSFYWFKGFKRIGPGEYELLISGDVFPSKGKYGFLSLLSNEVTNYKFIVVGGQSHSITSEWPTMSDTFFHITYGKIHLIDVDFEKTDLHLILKNNDIIRLNAILIILLPLLLGIGLSALFQELFEIRRKKNKKE